MQIGPTVNRQFVCKVWLTQIKSNSWRCLLLDTSACRPTPSFVFCLHTFSTLVLELSSSLLGHRREHTPFWRHKRKSVWRQMLLASNYFLCKLQKRKKRLITLRLHTLQERPMMALSSSSKLHFHILSEKEIFFHRTFLTFITKIQKPLDGVYV